MYLCSVDELVGETLGDGLDVPESRLPGSGAEQPDCLARKNSTFIHMNYWRVTDEREHSCFRGKKCLHHLLSNNVGNKTSLSCWEPSTLSDHHSPTWLTLLRGDTSTAWRLTVPALPMRVESSRGPELMMAFTTTFDVIYYLEVRPCFNRIQISKLHTSCAIIQWFD